jgi:DNA-binding NarL/FixJ family response regulator
VGELPSSTIRPTIRILFANGDAAFTRRATRILQGWDGAVIVGSIAGEDQALTSVEELQPDVVLVDLAIPDLAGLHLVTRLRTLLPQAGIVALTALGLDNQGWAVVAAGADAVVSKTTIQTDLLPAIHQIVRSRDRCSGGSATHGGTPCAS